MPEKISLDGLNKAMKVAYSASDGEHREEMLVRLATSMAAMADRPTQGLNEKSWRELNGDVAELAAGIATLAIALSEEVNK
jgi:hypothetical protein